LNNGINPQPEDKKFDSGFPEVHIIAELALHFLYYNFMRIHETLRVAPAMKAKIAYHIWMWEEFLGRSQEIRQVAWPTTK
jgi:hypothetical protein